MILTCPACGTQYVVKDGAIPAAGRQVRCAACGNSWRQHAEEQEPAKAAPPEVPPEATLAPSDPDSDPAVSDERKVEVEATEAEPEAQEEPDAASAIVEATISPMTPPEAYAAVGPDLPHDAERDAYPAPADDDFDMFIERDGRGSSRRSGLVRLLILLLLVAAVAAAFWMLAPPEWRQRLGLAAASETSLQLMMTHSDRQQLASGNELLAVSGRVINPTDQVQEVPPIRAELRSNSGKLVYSWTIAPPARTLQPGGSASFNSAELNVPAGGDQLTVTIGEPKA